ncbi:unnamed protein product [Owenia fusiformis]|uniref:Uncharacterized protein n=1 Tax=Owenia fusiformis TaxID=6347 RepID=A0A8J1U713_OWEFU|nr:unnamed protein product [Owenia fusiformis]
MGISKMDGKETKKKAKDLVTEFADDATAHGFGLIKRSGNKYSKILAIAVVLTCATFAVKNIWEQIKRYYDYHYIDTISIEERAIEMPSVSICTALPYPMTIVFQEDIILRAPSLYRYASLTSYGYLLKNLLETSVSDFKLQDGYDYIFENVLFSQQMGNAHVPDQEMAYLFHNINNLVIQCRFAGKPCNSSFFTEFRHPSFGRCFTFNGAGLKMDQDMTIRSTDPKSGLHFKVFLDGYKPIPFPNGMFYDNKDPLGGIVGLHVTIHQPGSVPFPIEDGFEIPPGYATYVTLKRKKRTRLGKPWNSCEDQLFLNGTDFAYTKAGCVSQCYQEKIMHMCGCVSYDFIIPKNNTMVFCEHLDLDNMFKLIQRQYGSRNLGNISILLQDLDKLKCLVNIKNMRLPCTECLPPCVETDYEHVQSQAYWPGDMTLGYFARSIYERSDIDLNENNAWKFIETHIINYTTLAAKEFQISNITQSAMMHKNFASLIVYFKEMTTEVTKQEADYNVSQLICDIGGALGIYIGASLISLYELGKLLVDLCHIVLHRNKNQVEEIKT